MTFFEIIILGLGLAMDAFAVSICKGLSVDKIKTKYAMITGAYFGGFQAIMPLVGYFLGSRFSTLISSYSHWVAFILLLIIGLNMIKEGCSSCESLDASFSIGAMLPLAIATSIDALAVGVSLAFLEADIVFSATVIGVITFLLSGAGLFIGNFFGLKYRSKAELAGGIILILIGTKILLEGLIGG